VPDADPGLQAIDLVRREIAALRKEFALSRQVQTWQDGRQWPAALAPVIHALQEQAVPAGLRALLIDGAQEATDPDEALQAMRQLVSDALSAPAAVRLERGVHAIVGPSGAGKTHMVTRLARAAALRAGAQQVAVIAFNDQRFGAWSHTRVMAAQAGVQCLRAGDVPTLRLLLDELSGHALVFIDTAGADALAQARLLQEMNLGIHLHLLMPADASIGSVRTLVDSGLTWRSLMVGKVDESISPWPLLQALCEGKPPVSYMSDSGQVQAPPRAFEARQLVDAAFERLAAELQALGLSPEVEVEVGSPALAGRLAGARIHPAAGAKVALS
jgi:flagellar biosynthesis GTPase FlhF